MNQPIKSSDAFEDDIRSKQVLDEAMEIHKKYQTDMVKMSIQLAKEEINFRIEKMHEKLYDCIQLIAENLILIVLATNGKDKWQLGLETKELAAYASVELIVNLLSDDDFTYLKRTRSDTKNAFVKHHSLNMATIRGIKNATDDQLATKISDKMNNIIPQITGKLWRFHELKETQRNINKELKIHNEKRNIDKATDDVEMLLAQEESAEPEQVKNMIEKGVAAQTKKMMAEIAKLKQELRKNSLGDKKNHSSKPKSNGLKSKNK